MNLQKEKYEHTCQNIVARHITLLEKFLERGLMEVNHLADMGVGVIIGRATKMILPVDYTKIPFKERYLVREQYIEEQKGLCMHCNCPLDKEPPEEITEKSIAWDLFPEGFLKYPVHLQHNHTTNMTEGAVHAYCNAVLWQYYGR